jgi:hypothetical protein
MSEAAKMIGVHASTLSRESELVAVAAGGRDKRLAPSDVLELAEYHKRRSLNDVAEDLITHARNVDPSCVEAVEQEVEDYFAGRQGSTSGKDALFADLERVLPPELFRKVRAMYFATDDADLDGELVSDLSEEEIAQGR